MEQFNTKGKNDDEVPKELAEFLHYVENITDEVAQQSESEKIRHIHERVCEVKRSEEIGVKYMQAWEEKYYEREEGREEGIREKLKELVGKKLKKGKTAEEIADMLEINHTFVSPSLRGTGMAEKLMQTAAEEISRQGKRAVLTCSYAINWFEHHEEFQDIIRK